MELVDSNPSAIYWMDVFHIDLLKNCIVVCLNRTKNKQKGAGNGPFKK